MGLAMGIDQAKWVAAKRLVNERDGGLCVRCGSEATDIHHRTPRGMGGSSDPETNYSPANLVSLCRSCHDYVHAHPAESYDDGFLVRSWDDPRDCPLMLANETVVIYLAADGNLTKYQQQTLF